MNQLLRRISGVTAAIVCLALLSAPAWAQSASPTVAAGANATVCGQIENTAKFATAVKLGVKNNTIQQPTSIASCLNGLLNNFSQYTNAFSGGFSFTALIETAFSTALNGIVNDLEASACKAINGGFQSVMHGAVSHTSVTNIMGSTGSNAILAPAAQGASQPANATGSDEAGQAYDDLDNVANSGGVTLTAQAPVLGNLTPDATAPQAGPPAPQSYDVDPTVSPSNATICIPPNNRTDLISQLTDNTSITDGADISIDLTPGSIPQNTNTDPDDLDDDAPLLAAKATSQPTTTQVDQSGPNLGDTVTGPAADPAGSDGLDAAPAPSAGASGSGAPGVTKTGTSYTANTQYTCMAGTGCSSQNGSISVAKNYQNPSTWKYPFGPAPKCNGATTTFPFNCAGKLELGNFGQCAQLTQTMINQRVGHSSTWRKGPAVQGNKTLQAGTPIATFFGPAPGQADGPPNSDNGQPSGTTFRFDPPGTNVPKAHNHMQHTGLYMGQDAGGLYMLEEGVMGLLPPRIGYLPWGKPWDKNTDHLMKSGVNVPAGWGSEMQGGNYYVIVH